jgi:hypothetical protein
LLDLEAAVAKEGLAAADHRQAQDRWAAQEAPGWAQEPGRWAAALVSAPVQAPVR